MDFLDVDYAVSYSRFSSDNQDIKSADDQDSENTAYANNHNMKIIKYFRDEAKSGRKTVSRDGFFDMLHFCKEYNKSNVKKIRYVLVWKFNRFARNEYDSPFYKNELKKIGIRVISITQPIEDSPEGHLLEGILEHIDAYYSENLSSDVRRGLKGNAMEQKFNGGIPPLGYDVIDRKYVINEKEAKIVKKIFDMYISGQGLLDIAATLNDLGYNTKRGNSFGKNSIYEILSNERYIGTYVYNKAYRHNRHTKREDTIVIEDAIPAIIAKEDFEKVKEIRKSHNKTGGMYSAKTTYLLSGLIVCSKCGANYTGRTSTKKKNGKTYKTGYYICGNRNKLGKCTAPILKQQELEDAIINLLTNKLLNSTDIDELTKKINSQYKKLYNQNSSEKEILEEQIKEKQKQIDNVTNAIASGVTSTSLIEKLRELEDIKSMLEENLSFVSNIGKVPEINAQMVKDILKEDTNKLVKNPQAKEIIKKWVKKIEVYDNEIIVHFTIDGVSSLRLVAGGRLELPTFGL